jgi:hypothetical protein
MKDRRRASFCLAASLLVIAQLLSAQSRPLSSADVSELAAGKRIFDAQCAGATGRTALAAPGPACSGPISGTPALTAISCRSCGMGSPGPRCRDFSGR